MDKIIGYRANGEPIWLHLGADGILAGPDEGGDPDAPDPDDEDDEDEDSGETGGTRQQQPPEGVPTGDQWYEARQRLRRAQTEIRNRGGDPQAENLVWDGGDGYPPSVEDWEKMQQLLRRAQGRSKDLKLSRRQTNPPASAPAAANADGQSQDTGGLTQQQLDVAVERAAERALATAEQQFKPALVREATKAALAAAGWSGGGGLGSDDPDKLQSSLSRVMKLIDVDEVSIDEQGNITGVDEQIQALKEEFPEWFRTRRQQQTTTPPANTEGRRRAKPPAPKPKSWAERIDDRFTGSRR